MSTQMSYTEIRGGGNFSYPDMDAQFEAEYTAWLMEDELREMGCPECQCGSVMAWDVDRWQCLSCRIVAVPDAGTDEETAS